MGDALKKRHEYETVKQWVDRFHILDSFFQVEFHKPGKNLIYPGAKVDLRIDTTAGTRLGVVIVDESVYLLRDKNRLTKERVSFKAF